MLDTVEKQIIRIPMKEWSQSGPDSEPFLRGYKFEEKAREKCDQLNRTGQIEFLELPDGLTIKTNQFVGSVQIGDLRLSILPKITGLPLLNLLRYAYNLRHLALFEPLDFGVEGGGFQDLLIQQLLSETNELIQRGLNRNYERVEEELQSPRGRFDFVKFFNQGGLIDASLPCIYHRRIEDNVLNRALLSGLRVALAMTNDLQLKTQIRRTSQILQQSVTSVPITLRLLDKAKTHINRMTFAYKPALTIIQILLESQGASIESDNTRTSLPGFLFDMNRFFQALINRFLDDYLEMYTVKAEHQLRDMISYDPTHNPQKKSPPTPRPDFAIMEKNKVKALLDTKYRDLWETDLPREMLYQLSLYAFSQDKPGLSTIIYPTLNLEAKEAWLNISHPPTGDRLATIKLRPINLNSLEQVIYKGSIVQRKALATAIAFGNNP